MGLNGLRAHRVSGDRGELPAASSEWFFRVGIDFLALHRGTLHYLRHVKRFR